MAYVRTAKQVADGLDLVAAHYEGVAGQASALHQMQIRRHADGEDIADVKPVMEAHLSTLADLIYDGVLQSKELYDYANPGGIPVIHPARVQPGSPKELAYWRVHDGAFNSKFLKATPSPDSVSTTVRFLSPPDGSPVASDAFNVFTPGNTVRISRSHGNDGIYTIQSAGEGSSGQQGNDHITNGHFTTDTSGWGVLNFTVNSGQAQNIGEGIATLSQQFASMVYPPDTRAYRLRFYVGGIDNGEDGYFRAGYQPGTGLGKSWWRVTVDGWHELLIVPEDSSGAIRFETDINDVVIDNVSMFEANDIVLNEATNNSVDNDSNMVVELIS